MRISIIFFLLVIVQSLVFGQITRDKIAWHPNVKEIHYVTDKFNIEKSIFDTLGQKIIEINYHPLMSPDGIGHGYDSIIYRFGENLKYSQEYFNWYGNSYLEEEIYEYQFKDYDSIVSFDKNKSVQGTQIRNRFNTDSLIGHINDKGFAIDTFFYHKESNLIVKHEVIWNQKSGKRIEYIANFEYDEKNRVIKEKNSFGDCLIYSYNNKGQLVSISSKEENDKKNKKQKKILTKVIYVYFEE